MYLRLNPKIIACFNAFAIFGAEFSDDVIEREELSILLKLALNKLTAKQQKTINALYFEGLSGKETARLLNCTPAMVTKQHKQALKNLRYKVS